MKYIVYTINIVFMFIHLFWEREHEWSRERKKGRERIPGRPQHGAQSHDGEIMTWAEVKSLMLNQLSHPGTPVVSSMVDGLSSVKTCFLSQGGLSWSWLQKSKNKNYLARSICSCHINLLHLCSKRRLGYTFPFIYCH